MFEGTINIGALAHQQDLLIRTFNQGLLLIQGGFKKAYDNGPDDEFDIARDLELEAPPQEPDPSWPNDVPH